MRSRSGNTTFDYKGYSEKQLLLLCDTKQATKRPYDIAYWTSEHYSIGAYLRGYARYPSWLPIFVYSQHGVGNHTISAHEIGNDAEAMFVFSQEALKNFHAISDKPCYQVTMPYVWYRRKHNIRQSLFAQGSLVFPFHSTLEVDVAFNISRYIDELRALPKDFHPIVVCLHRSDILKGLHKQFIERGLPVYTAGCPEDIYFGSRFYSLLHNFKYTLSNHVGSYAFYSIEMGIPFSLFGENGLLINRTDPNLPKGPINILANKYYKAQIEIFSGIHTEIPSEQNLFVKEALGIGQGVTRQELKNILKKAYKKRQDRFTLDSLHAIRWQIKQTKRKIKKAIKGYNSAQVSNINEVIEIREYSSYASLVWDVLRWKSYSIKKTRFLMEAG